MNEKQIGAHISLYYGNNDLGEIMKNNRELLSSVLKTTQMGQIGMRSVLEIKMNPELRSAMKSQLKEYDSIETEAHAIAMQYRWNLPEINPAIRIMTDRLTKMKLSFGNHDSRIAAMLIRGNTNGIIKGIKNLNHSTAPYPEICQLTNKLIETEKANLEQMQPFL